jgi:hypothetical protein
VVFVVKRKLRRPKTGDAILDSVKQYEDPSFDIEKSRSPVEFSRASYACGFHMKLLLPEVKIAHFRLQEVFGEPTRITQEAVEWVLKLPTKEVIKITLASKVELHGFNMTKSIEKWVERLEAA